MASNFTFLRRYWPDLAQLGELAELYLFSDPKNCIFKLGTLGERIAAGILSYEAITVPEGTSPAGLLRLLERNRILPPKIDGLLFAIRKAQNSTIRQSQITVDQAKTLLQAAYHLSCWYMEVYGDGNFAAAPYAEPAGLSGQEDFQGTLQKQEEALAGLPAQVTAGPTAASGIPAEKRRQKAADAAEALTLSAAETQCLAAGQVRLELSALPVVNYAIQQNKMPLFQTFVIRNTSDTPIQHTELSITASPAFCLPYTKPIDLLPAGCTYQVKDVRPILDAAYLAGLTEKVTGLLQVSLLQDGQPLDTEYLELTALAYDEWPGMNLSPELLASFVTPNHPEVTKIVARAADQLGQWTQDPSLDAYQTKDPHRVLSQAAAVYSALQEQNIVYAVPPASFERVGQRVRLCDAIIQQKMGTCLDLTLFYAACLEAIGLHPLLILMKEHIFAGVWLEELTFPEAVQDDPSLITKRLASGVNEIAVVECTAFTAGRQDSFDQAQALAERHFNHPEDIQCIVDIKRARADGTAPLPLRVQNESGWHIERAPAGPAAPASAPERRKETISVADQPDSPASKKAQWERKLLDLGLRNALINLRLSKTVIPLLAAPLDELEDTLSAGRDFSLYPRPQEWHLRVEDLTFETMHDAGPYQAMMETEFQNRRLRSSLTDTALAAAIKNLYRSAKASLEENGANTLYLALGLLRWYEPPRSTKPRYAPIILLPVELVRKGGSQGYVIRLRDDDPQMNITMLEKLKQDFGIVVNGLDPLPQDEHGIDIRLVFTTLRKAVMNQHQWDVLESAYLGIFSFTQFVMWNDIRNRSDDLTKNKIVQSLIEGRLMWDAAPMELGDSVSDSDVLVPVPLDASQLYAVDAAAKGKSFVLHGPPGTGKSQTITAMIANALAQGKSVLFIAEKMAALEVVQSRLDKMGIGPFCLELHSNKSRKKDVLEQLRQASEVAKNASSGEYERKAAQLQQLRTGLDAYVKHLHQTQPCGQSVFELVNTYETCREAPELSGFDAGAAAAKTRDQLEQEKQQLEQLVLAARTVGHPYQHPLARLGCRHYTPDIRNLLASFTADYQQKLRTLQTAAGQLTAALGQTAPAARADFDRLDQLARQLLRWRDVPVRWATAEDVAQSLQDAQTMEQALDQAGALGQELSADWQDTYFDCDAGQLLARYHTDPADLWQSSPALQKEVETIARAARAFLEADQLKASLADFWYDDALEADIQPLLDLCRTSPNRLWNQDSLIQQKVADLQQMAQRYLHAGQIREKLSASWQDGLYEKDGASLLKEYDAILARGFFAKLFTLPGFVKPLATLAKSEEAKKNLRSDLEQLATCQAELAAADQLHQNYQNLLQWIFPENSGDWQQLLARTQKVQEGLDLSLVGLLGRYQAFAGAARYSKQPLTCAELEERLQALRAWQTTRDAARAALADARADLEQLYPGPDSWQKVWQDAENCLEGSDWTLLRRLELLHFKQEMSRYAKATVTSDDTLLEALNKLSTYQSQKAAAQPVYAGYSQELAPFFPDGAPDYHQVADKARAMTAAASDIDQLYGGRHARQTLGGRPEGAQYSEAFCTALKQARDSQAHLDQLLSIDPAGASSIQAELDLCTAIQQHSGQLKEWCHWNDTAAQAREAGLGPAADLYCTGASHDEVMSSYTKALCKALIDHAVNQDPVLGEFTGLVFESKIEKFKELDQAFQTAARQEIYCRLAAKVPNFTREAATSSELGILQRAIHSGGRGLSIRRLFEQIPNLLPRLCPCMLMSPISAAQYLDPRREPFDLVVFDEASQLPTCKAVGALARGRDAVIVGDPKQMPPTSFFASSTVDEDNLEVEDLESILDDCLALNMPSTHLLWHYRSRHESLIAFSNHQFYDNKLLTFPSVNDRESKVNLVHVEGVFERGKSRCNQAEAWAVVQELQRRCHDPALSRFSVGIVTFNISQQNLIDDLLSEACARDPVLENWAFNSPEPLFIKNLENVQGDERDVVLFSVGYGPDEEGKVRMNFGPLNREGGWRRLNVAISRARCEMVVYASLTPEQMDLTKTSARGVAALKAFLEYADGRPLELDEHTSQLPQAQTTAVAGAICKALKEHGYDTVPAVGHSAYRVDIGVVDKDNPDQYRLGILLDGGSYRDAKTTRDREVAQISILEGLGWQILRVWTIDWWDNQEKVLSRIFTCLEQPRQTREKAPGPAPVPAAPPAEPVSMPAFSPVAATPAPAPLPEQPAPQPDPEPVPAQAKIAAAAPKPPQKTVSVYRGADLPVHPMSSSDLANPHNHQLIRWKVQAVLATEAPISENLLIHRVAQGCGIARTSEGIARSIRSICDSMGLIQTAEGGATVYWSPKQNPKTYRKFRISGTGVNKRDAKDVPVQEVANAVCAVLLDQAALDEDNLKKAAARLMGYARTGPVVAEKFQAAIRFAAREGRIQLGANGNWTLTSAELQAVTDAQKT